MLSVGTFEDIKKREVSDYLWIIFGITAIILLFFEPEIESQFTNILIALIIAPIVLIFWKFGFFGGADSFALIVLAVLAPHLTLSGNFISPLTTLTNAAFLSSVPLFANSLLNLVRILQKKDIFEGFEETTSKKIVAIFLGHRSKSPKFSFSIEKKAGEKKKFNFVLHHAENASFCTKKDSWVTPGIPYLIFIFAGFIIQIFHGDILLNFLMA